METFAIFRLFGRRRREEENQFPRLSSTMSRVGLITGARERRIDVFLIKS